MFSRSKKILDSFYNYLTISSSVCYFSISDFHSKVVFLKNITKLDKFCEINSRKKLNFWPKLAFELEFVTYSKQVLRN